MSSQQAPLAQIQLGHFTGSDHPFGVTASESAQSVLEQIGEHSEKMMHKLGWEAMRSPVRQPKGATLLQVYNNHLAPIKVFGDEKRRRERKIKHKRASEIVRRAIQHVDSGSSSDIKVEQIRLAEKEIITHALVSQTNTCLRLFYRYVSRLPGGALALNKSGYSRVIKIEESPFTEHSIVAYQQACELRQKFLNLLEQRLETRSNDLVGDRAAEVIVSAALFSRFGNPLQLQRIADSLSFKTYQYNGKLFVELPVSKDNGTPVFRWFPDKVSQLLIQGFYTKEPQAYIPPKRLHGCLVRLLSELIDFDKRHAWEKLAEIGQSLSVFEVPGHSAAVLNGKLNSVSIPLQQWVRMHSGKALKADELITDIQTVTPKLPPPNYIKGASSAKKVREFLRLLRKLFTVSASQPHRGNQKVSTARKRFLEQLIKQTFGDNDKQWPQLTILIAAWAIHLCRNGTRAKKNLAFNTVDKYTFMVARALLAENVDVDFLSADADAYESFYLDILEAQPEKRKEDIAGRLYEFHRFVARAYAVEEPVWTAIFRLANLNKTVSYADANLISEEEYIHIFEAINCSEFLHERVRIQYLVLLLLGFRFGLRFGEAHKIQYRDIQHDDSNIFITVRSNAFGDNKSSAAQRVVPLLEQLTQCEHHAFIQLLNWARAQSESDPMIALMSKQGETNKLIDKHEAASTLGQYIKLMTGDASLRFHHLRHSWATRLYAYYYLGKSKNFLASQSILPYRWGSFIGSGTCYPLVSLSTAIGHLHESTTLTHYVHAIDACLNQPCLDSLLFSTKSIAYSLCISHDNARQRMRRGTLFNLREIPAPNISLQPRPEKIEEVNIYSSKQHLGLCDIERFLLRLRETNQKPEAIAHELFIGTDSTQKILTAAAKVERASGYEFYKVEVSHNEQLMLSDQVRKAIHEELSQQKSYTKQNKNIIAVLQEKYEIIKNLSTDQTEELRTALKVWQNSFFQTVIIINDKVSLERIEQLKSTLLSEATLISESALTKTMGNKTCARKAASTVLKIRPGGKISTQQMLLRIIFVLAIYFEIT